MSQDDTESQGESQPQHTRLGALVAGARKLYTLANNPLSVFGLVLVVLSLLLIVVFVLITVFSEHGNPYRDIIGYLVLPSVFVMGLIAVPIGVIWKFRWLGKHRGTQPPRYVQINLHDRATIGALLVLAGLTFAVVLPGLAVSGYVGYGYTESTDFCAKVCHTVMEPQGTAHEHSPHARVRCAACHIGEGAGWFVKSKLSGTRQVFAVLFNSFPRPIPPAITELRPARETCEECHWPAKFFGSQLKKDVFYSNDEHNTRHVVRALVKTGGADESIGRVEGIHMHMLVAGKIEYVATDEHLQEIPWVRYTHSDGKVAVYRSDKLPNDAPPPPGTHRVVDCMDCHNRGAHHFYPPQRAIDLMIDAGRIDPNLPYIKQQAVEAVVAGYSDVAAAESGIAKMLREFYEKQYPAVWQSQQPVIERAIVATQDAYKRNFFPAMKVDWRTYPENIGHMLGPGCFRCHDGLHVDAAGQAINSDCTVCHTFLNEVPGKPNEFREAKFEHAMPLAGHEDLRCSQCHSGGSMVSSCRDCHNQMHGLNDWHDAGRLRREGGG